MAKDADVVENYRVEHFEFPKFTTALRAFTNLEKKPNQSTSVDNKKKNYHEIITKARDQYRKSNFYEDTSWNYIVEILPKGEKFKENLQTIYQCAKNLSSNESKELVDSTASYLFNLFFNENMVLQRHIQTLKQLFGSVSCDDVNKAFKAVKEITSEVDDSILGKLDKKYEEKKIFGWDIPFIPSSPEYWEARYKDKSRLKPFNLESRSDDDCRFISEFVNNLKDKDKELKKEKFDRKWLISQIRSWMNDSGEGMSSEEYADMIINQLKLKKSNDELQNELFEILGFDRFELIQTLLLHRNDVIRDDVCQSSSSFDNKTYESRPAVSSSVIFNSESEKYAQKLLAKEGRRLGDERRDTRLNYEDVKSIEKFSSLVQSAQTSTDVVTRFGTITPRLEETSMVCFYTGCRERCTIVLILSVLDFLCFHITSINLTPFFGVCILDQTDMTSIDVVERQCVKFQSPMKKKIATSTKYPNVYDIKEDVKATPGYIAGTKMLLPAGVERNFKPLYEEVIIPISEQPPTDIGKNLIDIKSLNKIGQLGFEGVKRLNRIQSVVFDAAYHTNENLLICAPTGAGKTNVALLTVMHEIEQHVENDVIKRDAFKIVYVAPMKALAAEITRNFNKRLNSLGLLVKELTGDMQLTKSEILETQMLVTTPEKWDVVTRKGTGDIALTKLVRLLIIDEVHLLHGDRGPVVEALVARTLRQVESSQSMIRIVGLSATLPNYLDVARFLRVNPHIGLFYFDSRFRPVPLKQTFIGVKATKPLQQMNDMDTVCYEKVLEQVQKGHQVMVFVHTRNGTIRTANVLKELAMKANQLHVFEPEDASKFNLAKKSISRLKNKKVAELFPFGFSCHHAGMLRADRTIIENYFGEGLIKVLVCTSTLAWGVNLPAHAVIIRGTEIYDAKHGSSVDLGILDVLQIFGRAGRPQFDTSGHGFIITSYDKLSHYLSLLTNQFPIESNFINFLADNLNAEIALGTISNVEEAIEWLSYTFLFVRMKVNPLVYGINFNDVQEDPQLKWKRRDWIHAVSKALDKAKMIRYNERTGDLNITDLGRTASHFYIKYDTVEIFNDMLKTIMTDSEVFNLIANAQEFQQLKVRDDEMDELDNLTRDYCMLEVTGGSENLHGKVNILLQTYLSRGRIDSFSLISDQSYIIQNAVRIARALFDIALRKKQAIMTSRFLLISKMLELQMWDSETPLKQFELFGGDILGKIEVKHLSVEKLREMNHKEIGALLRNPKYGRMVQDKAFEIPLLKIEAVLQPITRTVLRIRLKISADFKWNDKFHGKTTEPFWIWIEDPNSNFIYHSEYFLITRKQVMRNEEQELVLTIPISEPPASQYYVRAVSDKWLGSDMMEPLSFLNLVLPDSHPPHTDLLPLHPLPVSALEDPQLEKLYNFTHFNPIQTQIFHCLYHTDKNVLLGAPTGSGKTIVAEIAMFRVFRVYPDCKVVYIAPLKALVRERMEDWKIRLEKKLNRSVVELTGDVSPDIRAISAADVIVTTPEKWDGISRSWQTRNYVRQVALIVIDEIHLLGEDRGPVLEVIISRTNFISSYTSNRLRVIGLSTALANAKDLADWLGIGQMGLYNFRPSVRPVPLEVHISGFPGKHYCPRMATMNRPTFQAIRQHSPSQPALVFVSSRRQTRLTALDLIAYLAGEDNPKQWLHMREEEMDQIVANTKDSNLRLTLAFGIGMHHAGLVERDRKTVEELFLNQKIQVLIATATLAWGVNFPAHLVVIKGTEYYDGKLKRYVDMPITDVLQMMGRAGRPQFDEQGVAVVLVHDVKKNFYKKFLYEPFPVESSLLEVLPDHLNAEIVAGTVQTKQEALDYLTWTYFFRRLLKNPVYYQLEGSVEECVNEYLSKLIEKALSALQDAFCVEVQMDERTLESTSMGRIASFYYLTHQTMKHFRETLRSDLSLEQLIQALSDAFEFSQLPVRHNEDLLNGELSKKCPLPVNQYSLDSPHTKTQLLFQAHFFRIVLPCVDYLTDLKSVLDQSIRMLQAMIDICAEQGWLAATLRTQNLMQMVIQGTWIHESPLCILPHIEPHHVHLLRGNSLDLATLPGLMNKCARDYNTLAEILREDLTESQIEEVHKVLSSLPVLSVKLGLRIFEEEIAIPQPMARDHWIEVPPEQECSLTVRLKLLNKRKEGQKAFSPRFPRGTDEGWFLTLGVIEDKELLALKRVSTIRRNVSNQSLTFYTPKKLGRHILTIYIFSDCYLGLDQQYSFNVEVVQKESHD